MKNIKYIAFVLVAIMLHSCNKPGKIEIQNNISQVEISDVRWGDVSISYSLLPGETSQKITINKYTEELPASKSITFKMRANEMTVYLETKEEYLLKEDQDLLIILDDNTPVFNPLQ